MSSRVPRKSSRIKAANSDPKGERNDPSRRVSLDPQGDTHGKTNASSRSKPPAGARSSKKARASSPEPATTTASDFTRAASTAVARKVLTKAKQAPHGSDAPLTGPSGTDERKSRASSKHQPPPQENPPDTLESSGADRINVGDQKGSKSNGKHRATHRSSELPTTSTNALGKE